MSRWSIYLNEELSDGIAEAFIEWAKNEDLSFWR